MSQNVNATLTTAAPNTPVLTVALPHLKLHRPSAQGRVLVVVAATGVFDTATLELHIRPPAHSVSVERLSMTAEGTAEIELPDGFDVSGKLVGGTLNTSVEVTIAT